MTLKITYKLILIINLKVKIEKQKNKMNYKIIQLKIKLYIL